MKNKRYEKDNDVTVTGNSSKALGVWDFPIPTGKCSNPVSLQLQEYIEADQIGKLLNNPITRCVFFRENGYCFFAGLCNAKMSIPDVEVMQYKAKMNYLLENKYGPRPVKQEEE